jgi:hypothetical protein
MDSFFIFICFYVLILPSLKNAKKKPLSACSHTERGLKYTEINLKSYGYSLPAMIYIMDIVYPKSDPMDHCWYAPERYLINCVSC